MSSTNRGSRGGNDYYVTPVDDINTFLQEFKKDSNINYNELKILDPCAGGDIKHRMSYPEAFKKNGMYIMDTIDIREDSRADIKNDYLKCNVEENYYDMIITNPPFNKAEKIINKALKDVDDDGIVIMLLRLNFLGSQKRKKFWDINKPSFIYVHRKRMSFRDDNKTDSIEYAHFVWIKNKNPQFAQIRII